MGVLNKEQVDALFNREAVLIGCADCVPEFRVAALFGADAAEFATRVHEKQFSNGYGVGDYTLMYITYRGFLAAATFYNIRQLQKEVEP